MQIDIHIPDWVSEDSIDEASKILIEYELKKTKTPEGLLKTLKDFRIRLSSNEIEGFLSERR
ncbi:MAG: hypothetical protein ACOC5L_03930 [Halobacteriota archaeon]